MNSTEEIISLSRTNTKLGLIKLSASAKGLIRLTFLNKSENQNPETTSPGWMEDALDQVCAFLQGDKKEFDIPIDWDSFSPFQKAILQACYSIPFGKVLTYAELGNKAGKPNSSRAVGGVMARNPIPLIIPCHRVISADKKLHGYSAPGGLETKAWLLKLEGHKIVNQKLD